MLKHTGIVRRMDDLGRIVFPKDFADKCPSRRGTPLSLA